MKKKLISAIISCAMIAGSLCMPAHAAEAKKIGADYFSPMETNVTDKNFNDLRKLGDGLFGNWNTVVFSSPSSKALDENSYVEIFTTIGAKADKLYLATGNYDDQGIKKIKVTAQSDVTGEWENVLDSYEIQYTKNSDGIYEATVDFADTVTATRFRVYIQDANRTWGNIRVDEMYLMGTVDWNQKMNNGNLLYGASVEATLPDGTEDTGFNNGYLADGNIAHAALSLKNAAAPTEDAPYYIDIDFGSKYYSVDSAEMITEYPHASGINKVKLQYMQGGEYITAKEFDFARKTANMATNHYFTANNALDNLSPSQPIQSNKFRLVITDAMLDWGQFRINELMFYGKEVSQEEQWKKIGADYFSPMETNVGDFQFNILNKLNDGAYGNWNTVVFASPKSNPLDENSYVEIITKCSTDAAKLYLATGNYDEQGIKKIKVTAQSDVTGEWETVLDNCEVQYTKNADGIYEATIVFPKVVSATRFKVYIQDANRVYNNIRVDEMYILGTEQWNRRMNNGNLLYLANNIQFTDLTGTGGSIATDIARLYDGTLDNAVQFKTGTKAPDEEEPYYIDIDFGGKYYSIDSAEMITREPGNSSINKAALQYMYNGEYITAEESNFNRKTPNMATNHYHINNTALDNLSSSVPMKSNKFRLAITDAVIDSWNQFKVNELMLCGKEISQEEAVNVGKNAVVFTTISGDGNPSNMTDSDYSTVFTASGCGESEIIELFTNDRTIDISKLQIRSADADKAPKNITLQAYASGCWQTVAENAALTYTDNAAEIEVNKSTDRVRIIINNQSDISINSINYIGIPHYISRTVGTANAAPNAKVMTTLVSEDDTGSLNDGNTDTVFGAKLPDGEASVTYALPGYFTLDKVVIGSEEIKLYDVYIKNEADEWVKKFENCVNDPSGYVLPERITANEYKIVITSSESSVAICETELIGECRGAYPESVVITDFSRTSENIGLNAAVTNFQTRNCPCTVIAAVYDKEDGSLIDVQFENVVINGNETRNIPFALTAAIEREIYVKTFVFSDMKAMQPLSAAAVETELGSNA